MLWYARCYDQMPSARDIRREKSDLDTSATSESISRVLDRRVILQSLSGKYVYMSLRFADAARVILVTWVTFESEDSSPWLVVLLRPNILVLHGPNGSQMEASLPFQFNYAWPISLNASGGEGMIFQRTDVLHSDCVSLKQCDVTLFSMTHPLHELCPVGQMYTTNHTGIDLSHDTSERVIFVLKDTPPLLVSYSSTHRRHALWYLVADSELYGTHDLRNELFSRRIHISSSNDILATTSGPALRAFRADDENDANILYLVLPGSTVPTVSL
jgi:hypothetical protein